MNKNRENGQGQNNRNSLHNTSTITEVKLSYQATWTPAFPRVLMAIDTCKCCNKNNWIKFTIWSSTTQYHCLQKQIFKKSIQIIMNQL